jgi:hypothetical protein
MIPTSEKPFGPGHYFPWGGIINCHCQEIIIILILTKNFPLRFPALRAKTEKIQAVKEDLIPGLFSNFLG